MPHLKTTLNAIRRPKTLIRAARYGLEDYNRARDLKRLTGQDTTPGTEDALRTLLSMEETLEERRTAGRGAYSVGRHIEVLAAIMGETRLLPNSPAA